MADEYQSKFSGEEIDEILDKAKAAEDDNYGLGEYYKKDEVDSKIGDGVPTMVSELENDSLYVSQKELNSETDTIKLTYGYKITSESNNIPKNGSIDISIDDDDIGYVVDASNTVTAEYVANNGDYSFAAKDKSYFYIDNLEDKTTVSIFHSHSENVTITITRIKRADSVIAGVKESSIGLKHLNDEVIDELSSSGATYSGGNTETISMSVSNTRIYTADADVRIGIDIPINDDDIKVKIYNNTSANIGACIINLEGGLPVTYSGNLDEEIDLTQYDGVTSLTIGFDTTTGEGETLEVIITSSKPTISADVKEGSIQPKHLAEEYYTKSEIDNMDIGGGGGSFTETDPTVPDWAKQPNKPTYTAEEVGALSADLIPSESSTIKISYGNNDITEEYDVLGSVNIPVEDGVIQYSIEYLNDPPESLPIGVSGKNGEWEDLAYNNPTIITLDDYDYEIAEICISSNQENKVFVTKFYDEEVIKADIKEGSIQTKHLADGVVPTKTSQLENDSEYVNQGQLNVAIPTNVSQLVNDEGYAKEEQKITIANGETITVTDNTSYVAQGEISNLSIVYPDADFISSLYFTLASDGDITITLPESKYIGGAPAFANGETWELSIKNGVVVGGKVE